jgi:hypothetical protein
MPLWWGKKKEAAEADADAAAKEGDRCVRASGTHGRRRNEKNIDRRLTPFHTHPPHPHSPTPDVNRAGPPPGRGTAGSVDFG